MTPRKVGFKPLLRLVTTLAVAALALIAAYAATASGSMAEAPPYANGRFGFGLTGSVSRARNQGWPEMLNAGWYWDWGARGESQLPPLEYAQTVRLAPIIEDSVQVGYTARPTGTALLDAIAEQPGAIWMIGNEPDCTLMDNMLSQWYARAYHDLYHRIKAADPTARVAAGNIVQPTPQRLMYLDRVLSTYRDEYGTDLPADLWVIHSYILCETCYPFKAKGEPFAWGACWVPDWPSYSASKPYATFYSVYDHWDVDIFAQRIVDFRQWMHDNGYRNHPLVLSEYGVLFYEGLVAGTSLEDDVRFMLKGYDWMREARDPVLGYAPDDDRLIQRWAWFSLDHGSYPGGTLFNPDTLAPTLLATAYATYTSGISPTVDLLALAPTVTVPTAPPGTPVTATVHVTVANAGNVPTQAPVVAKLIANPVTSPTQATSTSSTVLDDVLACCGDHRAITLTWPNYIVGETYDFYVSVLDVDLKVRRLWSRSVSSSTLPLTTTLNALVANDGYSEITDPVTVTFYLKGLTATLPLGHRTLPELGCCGRSETVTLTWQFHDPGLYQICATAATPYLTSDPTCGYVGINPSTNFFLPLIYKSAP
jgi:hypothetical protein